MAEIFVPANAVLQLLKDKKVTKETFGRALNFSDKKMDTVLTSGIKDEVDALRFTQLRSNFDNNKNFDVSEIHDFQDRSGLKDIDLALLLDMSPMQFSRFKKNQSNSPITRKLFRMLVRTWDSGQDVFEIFRAI